MSLAELGPVELIPLIDRKQRALCNGYLQRYHPLGYKRPFGYRQRYFIEAGPHRLGCIVLSGAAKALGARDRWIGWTDRQRLANLPWVVNNSRYLIFPWVEVANLASHVLGQLARRVGDDWARRWGYRPVLLETFVDPAHFHGGCYRATGWALLGRTTGEGLVRPGKQYRTTPKLIFAKPLQADFRRLLCSDRLQGRSELCASQASVRDARQSKRGREKKRQQRRLRRQQREAELTAPATPTPSNRKSPFESPEQESAARQDAVSGLMGILRLMLYGLLVFVFQYGSRRAANGAITRPMFERNLRLLFPQLESRPHSDTLFRLLCRIDVSHIEQAHIALVNHLIRGKKFIRYLINNCYPIAIDGSQKIAFSILWDDHLLQRKKKRKTDADAEQEPQYQYYVYVLEASLSFRNGMVIPLMSEFLEYETGEDAQSKQDCEQKAFHRLAARIKEAFPRLPIMLLLDGLYPNGPILARCRTYHWDLMRTVLGAHPSGALRASKSAPDRFVMIVLKDGSLPTVWEEYRSLRLLCQEENQLHHHWGERRQHFQWVNQIRYEFGDQGKNYIDLHVVLCHEHWEEVDPQITKIVPKKSKYAWISSRPIDRLNVHTRCNLGARYRWGIEAGFLVEKHQGYAYEHAFAKHWNAMKGYHYLMRLAHLFHTLARFSKQLAGLFAELGVRAALGFIRNTLAGPWLDAQDIEQRLAQPFRLRLR